MKKRLRKKLRLQEFQQMGFLTDFNLDIPFTDEAEFAFWDKLIDFVEERQLTVGGSMNSFYVACAGRGTVTEADRIALGAWLHQQPEVADIKLWPLDDAWYGPFQWL